MEKKKWKQPNESDCKLQYRGPSPAYAFLSQGFSLQRFGPDRTDLAVDSGSDRWTVQIVDDDAFDVSN